MFTADQIRHFAPIARQEIIDALITGKNELTSAGITTPLRLQHFMAQIATETGGLKALEENLNYSADRLRAVWPARFKSAAKARACAHNPEKLANEVYGGRLGNLKTGDGWRYRGSGMLQTTGRFNFRSAGHENDPEVLRTPAGALTSALKFWVDNGCNGYADSDDVTGLRRVINGGTNGLAECKAYLKKAKANFVGVSEDDEDTASVPTLSQGKVKALQEQLVKLGYVELGKADGYMGSKTVGAISAFQAENGLDVIGKFDEDTQEAIFSAPPRSVSRTDDRPDNSRILSHAGTLQKGALGLMGAAGLNASADPLSMVEGVGGYVNRAKSILAPFGMVTDFLTQHWMISIGAACGVVYAYGRKIEHARIEDHLTGASA